MQVADTRRSARQPATRRLQVLVVDDDPLARQAIRRSLEDAPEFEICGEAGTGGDAIALVAARAPDIVVMDVTMPGLDGIAATRRILRGSPEVRVVVFTAAGDEELALLALRAGACGYLTKGLDLTALPRVLRRVSEGEAAIPRALATRLVERFRLDPDGSEGVRPVRSDLTAREWEVLDLLCAERATAEIAGELGMSVETVRSHVKHILRKLGVHSRAEAVRAAEGLRHPLLRRPLGGDPLPGPS